MSKNRKTTHISGCNWPKISIVTPSYNQGQYIEETILSIINQNYPNLEYTIIDGGSTDNTVEIIKKYEQYITYWVSEPDQGQSHAINKGLAKCTGDIFNWVNSDDYLQPLTLEKVATYFLQNDILVLGGKRRRFFTNNDFLPIHKTHDGLSLHQEKEKGLVYDAFIQIPTFFSLQTIKDLGGVNDKLHYVMDSELWLRFLLEYGQDRVMIVDEWLANYRLHKRSKTVAEQAKFRLELNQAYYSLFIRAGVHQKVVKRLTGVSNPYLEIDYNLENVSKAKLRRYIYGKALQWYVSLYDIKFFLTTTVRYFQGQPPSLSSLTYFLKSAFLIRIKSRLV